MNSRRTLIARSAIVGLSCVFGFAAAGDSPSPTRRVIPFGGQTMGTTYTVKVFADDVDADLAIEIDAELRSVNDQMSTYLKSSEISRFNASESTDWFNVSREFANVVDQSLVISRKTDGAFDVTIGPLIDAWNFGAKPRTTTPPDESALDSLSDSYGYEKLSVRLDPPALRKSTPQLRIDLSAIAKGHGVDRVTELLNEHGYVDSFVEIGGEVRVSGSKGGQPWRVGIQKPDAAATAPMYALALSADDRRDDASMATSGDYRNYFESDGVRYSHTIDPRTRKPITHSLASVSVTASDCQTADAWATALNVLGRDEGLAIAEREGLNAFFIVRSKSGWDTAATGSLTSLTADPGKLRTAPTGQPPRTASSLIPLFAITAALLGLVIVGMAVGVIFGRNSISGSCGGIASIEDADGNVSCSLCSNPADACKDLRRRMGVQPQKVTATVDE